MLDNVFLRYPAQFYRHFERERSSYLTDSRERPPHVPASPTDHTAGGPDEDLSVAQQKGTVS